MGKELYALLTQHCNLSCPYCDIKDLDEDFNRDLFMKQLKEFDGDIILFGGEPTLYQDRLFDIYYSDPEINRKIITITSNLMVVNDKLLTFFQILGKLGTSWNPSRFNKIEYNQWLTNINIIHERVPDIKIMVLVTMVDELLNLSADEFLDIIKDWNSDILSAINFEYYVGETSTPEYFERCDNWLCEIYKKWNSKIELINIKRVSNWWEDCSEIYSLFPNGEIRKGCPHSLKPRVPIECYSCERVDICKPCQLQSYCSFPKKFAKLVLGEETKI